MNSETPEASVTVGGIVFTFVSTAPPADQIPIGDPRPIPTSHQAIPEERAKELLAAWCQEQTDYLWGQPRQVTPVLVPFQWGDGRQLVALRPIIVRQAWYVLAVDSTVEIGRGDAWRDLLDDEIYPALEDYFGRADEDHEAYMQETFDPHAAWPKVNHDCGHEWWQLDDGKP